MDNIFHGGVHGRKLRFAIVGGVMLLALTCYFCWEILYQEHVILDILRMSKNSEKFSDSVKIGLNTDHLEDVVEAWFEQKKHEVIENLRSGDTKANKPLGLSKQDLLNEVKEKLRSKEQGDAG